MRCKVPEANTSRFERHPVILHSPNLSHHSTYSLIHPSQDPMRDAADIPQNALLECCQATSDITPDGISCIDGEYQHKNSQRPLALHFQESFPSIFDVPVIPIGEHTADGEVDL